MDEQEYQEEGRGRSARKREAKQVEELARRLVELPDPEAEALPLDGPLAKELQLARTTRGHSSRKRQIKHLAGLLRRDDEQRERVATALEGVARAQREETAAFHQLEELRDRLCSPSEFDAALAEAGRIYPRLDVNKLAGLARSVHANSDKKAYRDIFRRLRKAAEEDPAHAE